MAVNKCIKYSLFLFNLLFWISGCIILGVSIYLKVSKNGNVIMDEAVPFVDLLIAVGVIIMVLGFLGCCGAIKENRCMLILFFIGLLLIFILLLIAGILGAVGEKKSQVWVKETLEKLLPLKDQKPEVQTDLQKLEVEAIVMLLALVMTRRLQKASSAEVTMDLSYRNATNMEMATTPQAPPMLPATQAPPMLPATQAPPMLSSTQAPLHASSYYQPPPPYQYDGKH
uniref:Tetraspanin-8-like n=1 Tax=Oncorhynchus tshawytscha TaxID=74940 RepID=A0AAZ3S8Q5_ONCTS